MPEAATALAGKDGTGSGAPGANAPGGARNGDPFYHGYRDKLKPATLAWLDGKNFAGVEVALDSGAESDRMFRERNVMSRPDPANLNNWEGWGVLGWDADRAKYGAKVKPPKQPNDAPHDAGFFDAAVSAAHELRMPPAALEGLLQKISDKVNERLSVMASNGVKSKQEYETKLRETWKTENDYALGMENAKRAAKALGFNADDISEMAKVFGDEEGKSVGSVRLTLRLAEAGKLLAEGKLINDDGLSERNFGEISPARAEAELRKLEGDPEFVKVFRDNRHAQHEDYKAKWQRLADIAAKDPKIVNPQPRRVARG
jgi:hypothetical protein